MPQLTVWSKDPKQIEKARKLIKQIRETVSDIKKNDLDHLIEALVKYKESIRKEK